MERRTFSIRWNHHKEHVLKSVNMALVNKEFVDVTILCSQSGGSVANWTFDAHKVK